MAITDFGLSRLIESDGGDRDVVGTPSYMPPEQFMMAEIGPHCDWYSFSCIAYELLTGERLFRSEESARFLHLKLREPSLAWPIIDAGDELCHHLCGALQPMVEARRLDLATLATWAKPVPDLVGDTREHHPLGRMPSTGQLRVKDE